MLYLPAPCPVSIWSVAGKWPRSYTWADPSHSAGFLLPSANESAAFWGDVFDYGRRLAAVGVDPDADAWEGV